MLTVGTITATVGDEMVSSLIHGAGPVTPPDGAVEIVGRVAMETLVQLILGFSIAVALAAPIAVLGGLYWLGRYIYREAPSRLAAKSGERDVFTGAGSYGRVWCERIAVDLQPEGDCS